MKKLVLTTACIFALTTAGALAQSQPAPGASSEGNVGPGAGVPRTTTHIKKGSTTGMGGTTRQPGMANPSSSGNVGPGTNNNTGKQPGGR
jgi:hypothetical protein